MTCEEILKLEPGHELDRLIAERVMGWKEGKDFGVGESGIARYIREGPKYFERTRIEAWSPSTDIAAAWEVIADLLTRYNVSVYSARYPIRWFVQIVALKDWETKALVQDENLPLAICRAALAVMEVNDE